MGADCPRFFAVFKKNLWDHWGGILSLRNIRIRGWGKWWYVYFEETLQVILTSPPPAALYPRIVLRGILNLLVSESSALTSSLYCIWLSQSLPLLVLFQNVLFPDRPLSYPSSFYSYQLPSSILILILSPAFSPLQSEFNSTLPLPLQYLTSHFRTCYYLPAFLSYQRPTLWGPGLCSRLSH